jgi:hypothetical protein
MRPIEQLLGPCGAIGVEFSGTTAKVTCHNGATNKDSVFETTFEIGNKIVHWIEGDKWGIIQNVIPELAPELREMCISGVTPEEWAEMVSEPEEGDFSG